MIIKNVGNAPAIKVSWHGWLLISASDPFKEQSLRCEKVRQIPFGIGPTIFPNDQYPEKSDQMGFGAGISWNEINEVLHIPGESRAVSMDLIGCVDYTFSSDEAKHHQFGFVRYVVTDIAYGDFGAIVIPNPNFRGQKGITHWYS